MELRFAADLDPAVRAALGYRSAVDALLDPRGWTVRCTPDRRTVRGPVAAGRVLFRKLQAGSAGMVEWRNLHRLVAAGFDVPVPVCVATGLGQSVLVIEAVPGRPLDTWLAEAAARGDLGAVGRYGSSVVAPVIRRLHGLGLVHRDLYTNHLFATAITTAPAASPPPALIDVQRVFRPRWRRRRWQIKDLAGLLSSVPDDFPRAAALRFLREYLGGLPPGWKRLARAVGRKSQRIRAHQPKYGRGL